MLRHSGSHGRLFSLAIAKAIKAGASLKGITTGALCASALLCGASRSTLPTSSRSVTAVLLVARPTVRDPTFAHTVVLAVNTLGPAPVGLIVNRPTPLLVSRLFPRLKHLAHRPAHLYFGGPVALDTVWFLIRAPKRPAHTVPTCPGVYLSTDPALLLRLLEREQPMQGLRIFMGHAGWAPGQLQREIVRGDWRLRPAAAATIFSGHRDHPWPALRSRGRRI